MTIELLIFDCDGVLIDSEPMASGMLAKALERAGISLSHAEVHRRFTGLSGEAARRLCREELGLADPDPVFADAGRALYDEFSRSLQPMAGMEKLVGDLKLRKCVASNSDLERLRRSLGLFGLWAEFAPHIYSAEMVARPKPAPDLFLHCAAKLGVEPRHCLVIDDSALGVRGAVAAGMAAIGFVDPADPRSGRHEALKAAGALQTVEGAGELALALAALSSSEKEQASSERKPAVETAS
ncbi:HAD family hydrolase [Rhizobium mesosinicum]|uniref:HAD-IA family hydrolase n=1 Tax=Rhizobium mesosinicum TaxID=335017 RepID=A0ABS7GN38_9HYPH|nr:HAD-IA family hydrolase [Rhizobium mesosinicum]MBW9051351.1 HAD-IA family hydrolase [Rhizobium mesosinicum]